MDKPYPDSARRYRSPRGSRSTRSPIGTTPSPQRPQSVASVSSPRDDWETRRSVRTHEACPRPHNGATCDNSRCDAPEIAEDERSYTGPEGLRLCRRCYKRFKTERKRAKEEQRAMTDRWKIPKRQRTKPSTPLPVPEESQKPTAPSANIADPNQSQQSTSRPYNELPERRRREMKYSREAPVPGPHSKESTKQVPPVPPPSGSNKSPSLYNFPTSSLKEFGRHGLRPHRKHRSRHERDDDEKHMRSSHARAAPPYREAEFYKYGREEESDDGYDWQCCCSAWSRKRKCVIIGLAVISTIVLIIIIALAATLSRKGGFKYIPSTAQVNSTLAFESGGGTRDNVNDTTIGIGAGVDVYKYYRGNASEFPPKEEWISFKDMWDINLDTFKNSCEWLGHGENNTPEMIQDIYDAIQDRANASLVDHRIILGTIIQETNGCPLNPSTTSSGGTRNPGLMQSHNGHEYDPKHSRLSIFQMIQDGTQGTEHGWGLVDNLNTYGNPYKAMRGYNSGYIPESGDLSDAAGATGCYVSDIANRLTGWVRAKSTCPGET